MHAGVFDSMVKGVGQVAWHPPMPSFLSRPKILLGFLSSCSDAEIDLKKAAKMFGSRFASGSSVTGPDEITIQGDVNYDLIDFVQEKWPEVRPGNS